MRNADPPFLPGPESTIEVEEVGVGVSHRLLDFLDGEHILLGIQPPRDLSGNRNAGRPESGGRPDSHLGHERCPCLVSEM